MTDAAVVARVPIYGFRDAGRNFWKQLREVIQKAGIRQNKIIKALYSLSEDGDCKVMLATHVDDICFACKPGYEHRVKEILDFFDIRKEEDTEFRFCGREIKQDAHGNISVTCKDTSEKITPVNFRVNGRKPTDKGTQGEIAQVRSVVGSLSWVARQCRPELSYSCSKLQIETSHSSKRLTRLFGRHKPTLKTACFTKPGHSTGTTASSQQSVTRHGLE